VHHKQRSAQKALTSYRLDPGTEPSDLSITETLVHMGKSKMITGLLGQAVSLATKASNGKKDGTPSKNTKVDLAINLAKKAGKYAVDAHAQHSSAHHEAIAQQSYCEPQEQPCMPKMDRSSLTLHDVPTFPARFHPNGSCYPVLVDTGVRSSVIDLTFLSEIAPEAYANMECFDQVAYYQGLGTGVIDVIGRTRVVMEIIGRVNIIKVEMEVYVASELAGRQMQFGCDGLRRFRVDLLLGRMEMRLAACGNEIVDLDCRER
jgi:hypothetical protein